MSKRKVHFHPDRVRDAVGRVACGRLWFASEDSSDWSLVTCERCHAARMRARIRGTK